MYLQDKPAPWAGAQKWSREAFHYWGISQPRLYTPIWEGAGDTVFDLSGNGYNWSIVGNVLWTPQGLDLNGVVDSLRVTMPANTGGLTCFVNLTPTDVTTDQYTWDLGTSGTTFLFGLGHINGYYIWHDHPHGRPSSNPADYQTLATIGKLDRVAWSVDGNASGNMRIYLDGKKVHDIPATANNFELQYNGPSIYFGRNPGEPSLSIIESIAICGEQLSDSQVEFWQQNPYFPIQPPKSIFDMMGQGAAAGPTAHAATITNGISAADVHAGLGAYLATITDGLGMVDTHSSGIQALLSEGILSSDIASVVSALFVTLTDGVNTSDQSSPLKGMVATLSESVNVGDTLDSLLILLAEISEGVDFGDVPSIISLFLDTITDGITAGDTPDPFLALLVAISEGVDFGDSTGTFSQFLDSLTDGVDFGDVNNAIGGYIKSISDGVTTSDTVSPLLALLAAVSDGGIFGDVAGTINQFLDAVSDSIIVSDVNFPNVGFIVTVTDDMNFGEVLSSIFAFGVIVTDGFSTGDVTVYPSEAQGEVNVTFVTARSRVTFTVKRAGLTFDSKQSNITFQEG